MIRSEPILGVQSVPLSSKWYQKLLNCIGSHGGEVFEILRDEGGTNILSLHRWGDHGHPTLLDPKPTVGNGLILYFVVDDLDQVWENALGLNAEIEEEPHLNTNSGRIEFSIRDLDHYYISVCTDNPSTVGNQALK